MYVSVKWVSERLALVLKVHEKVRQLVADGKLSLGHAVIISKIKEADKQLKFAQLILENKLSIKQAEEALIEFLSDTIFTIGYEGRTLEKLIELLKKHEIKTVFDIRHEVEFVKPEFSMELLKRQLPMQGIRYIYIKELGVPKIIREPYIEGKLSYNCFKQGYLWNIEKHREIWEKQIREARRSGFIALLCVERYPFPTKKQKHYCHRHILAEYLVKNGLFEKRVDLT